MIDEYQVINFWKVLSRLIYLNYYWLVVWNMFFSIQLVMSWSQLTNSIIFQRGRAQPPTRYGLWIMDMDYGKSPQYPNQKNPNLVNISITKISGGCRKPVVAEAPRQALRLGPMALGIFGRGLKFRFGDPRCYEFSWAIAKHFRHENIKKTGLMLLFQLFQLFLVAFPFRAVSKDMKWLWNPSPSNPHAAMPEWS